MKTLCPHCQSPTKAAVLETRSYAGGIYRRRRCETCCKTFVSHEGFVSGLRLPKAGMPHAQSADSTPAKAGTNWLAAHAANAAFAAPRMGRRTAANAPMFGVVAERNEDGPGIFGRSKKLVQGAPPVARRESAKNRAAAEHNDNLQMIDALMRGVIRAGQ